MDKEQISYIAKTLYKAEKDMKPIKPLTDEYPGISIEDAYWIQLKVLSIKLKEGRKVVGKKIGLTSKAMQEAMKVNEPDYGHIYDNLVMFHEDTVNYSDFICPKIEPEIAFILKQELKGPAVNIIDVLKSTHYVYPVFEIIDSRIGDWKIKIQDSIADNASCGKVILSSSAVKLDNLDLAKTGLVFRKNGLVIDTAAGASVLGHPAHAVAWLCNKLCEYDRCLKAGEIILSGSFVGAVDVSKGDYFEASFDNIGTVRAVIK